MWTCAVLVLATAWASAQLCGDCNGDGVLDVRDALSGAQHTVRVISLGAAGFARCNVVETLGGPSVPGAAVNVLDAFTIAQFVVGIGPPLACATGTVVSAGPYDIDFLAVPAETVSDRRFEVTIGLFDQATGLPAIPSEPVQVTLSLESGFGPLSGSVRQWMRTESKVFGNLMVGAVGSFSLRARGASHDGVGVSGTIANLIAVESDVRGTLDRAPITVRFVFRDHGVNTPVASGVFDWEMVQVSTGDVLYAGSRVLAGQTFVDATIPSMSLPYGFYRVDWEVLGTSLHDSHPLYVFPIFSSSEEEIVCTLPSGRVGVPYTQDIRQIVGTTFGTFNVLPDQLPPGLTCPPTSGGVITGTPTRPGHYQLVGFGIDPTGYNYSKVSFSISIFSWRDTEIESGIDFTQPGPYLVSTYDVGPPPPAPPTRNFRNTWSCEITRTVGRFYYPSDIASMRRVPAVAFLHDVGVNSIQYGALLRRIASYGYVVCSVSNPGWPSGTCILCGGAGSSSYGFARAAGFQKEALAMIVSLDGVPISDMYQRIDLENVFWAGHGRGGATTLFNLVLNPGVARGAIAILPIDPKAQACLVPSYLGDIIPSFPTLNLSAELDGDAVWPIAENAMEDAVKSGMDTHVTLYGANHNFVVDAPFPAEAPAHLCRDEEQARVAAWIVAFLERQARGDLRLEGRLYTGEMASSGDYAVFGRRDMQGTILVDDHQTTGPATNLLGGMNTATGVTIDELNTHPVGYDFGRTISHRRMLLTSGSGSNNWSAPPGSPVNASALTNVCFRARQYRTGAPTLAGVTGWQAALASWSLTLVDDTGQAATISLMPSLPTPAPATPCSAGLPPSTAMDRFHRFCAPLADFAAANPAFNPAAIESILMSFAPASPAGTQYLAVDDLRFE